MTIETTLERLQLQLYSEGIDWQVSDNTCFNVLVVPDKLLEAVKIIHKMATFYLAAITGLDDGTEANTLQVLYHFCSHAYVITLRLTLKRKQASVPSICAIIPYASPFERETGEMFGITFTDTPDTSRLFLPDDWSDGVYPLRKDAVLEEVQHDKSE